MQREQHFRIVVALDLSEYAEIVLEHALDQASRHSAPDLHFLYVIEHRGDEVVDRAQASLGRLVRQGLETFGRGATDWRARLHVRAGKPHEEIVALANEVDADLVVVGRFGAHRRALGRLGSIAHRVLENAPCPTLAVTLLEREVEAHPQCPECVRVRTETDGERWFCAEHTAPDRVRLSTTFLPPSTWIGGGTMW